MIGRGFLLGLVRLWRTDATPNGSGGARYSPQIGGNNLRRGRRAGRSAGKKQLEVNKPDFAGQFRPLDQGHRESIRCQRCWNPDVRDLADAAGPVALAFGMDVTGGKNYEEDSESAQRESQKRPGVRSPVRCPLSFHRVKPPPGSLDAGRRKAVSSVGAPAAILCPAGRLPAGQEARRISAGIIPRRRIPPRSRIPELPVEHPSQGMPRLPVASRNCSAASM